MKKITIGEKEIFIDESQIQALTDDELELACGGTEGYFDQPVCKVCGFMGWRPQSTAEKRYLIAFHKSMGCPGKLDYES